MGPAIAWGKRNWQRAKYATPKAAYRSGLEEKIAEQLKEAQVAFGFEDFKLSYEVPASTHTYCPDFRLPNGIVVESKGLFQTEDRRKMKIIKATYPDLDLRMVFSNAQAKIAKKSKTTYAAWCETNGFKWAHKVVPNSWLTEPPNARSLRALETAAIRKKAA